MNEPKPLLYHGRKHVEEEARGEIGGREETKRTGRLWSVIPLKGEKYRPHQIKLSFNSLKVSPL